jgi:hypothetical protein
MKRDIRWQIILGLVLVGLCAAVYYVHYLIFRDVHHIFIYLIGDIAFVFFEVLVVTLILHQLLSYREKKSMLNKLNMVIGAFFSEAGTGLLKMFSVFDSQASGVTQKLVVSTAWSEKEFQKIRKALKNHAYSVDTRRGDLEEIRSFLKGKRTFLLTLLENPNLLEHESFTDLLWAVFHLTEELLRRGDLKKLPDPDYQHLAGDIQRAYRRLISEWLDYMRHLKQNYPYLFSLAMRTNPFDTNASVEVKS